MTSEKLKLSAKLTRLAGRLQDPEWRRYGYIPMAAKAIGLVVVLGIVLLATSLLGSHGASADDGATLAATDIVNPVNTAWTLIAAFLVFGMQVGFTMLEAGFCR